METFINFITHNWRNIAIPVAVFIFCTMALLQLKNRAFHQLRRQVKETMWLADIILDQSIKRLSFIICIILSAYLGLATSMISQEWKNFSENSLLTMFIFTLVLIILNVLRELFLFLEQHLNLPVSLPIMMKITRVAIIAVSVLVVLGLWGAPTGPVLLLIAIAGLLILLSLRDAAPNFFAGIQINTWQHIRVDDQVKLENGEVGRITKIGWTHAQLQTTEGNSIIIPNSHLTKQSVTRIENNLKKQGQSDPSSILTERELEIAKLISKGTTNKEIANILYIAENTAKVHVKNILKKLDLKNRQQLAVYAVLKQEVNVDIKFTK